MTKLRRIAVFCVGLAMAAAGLVATSAAQPVGKPLPAPPITINFGSNQNVLDLKPALTPDRAPGSTETDGSSWYFVQVTN